MVSDFQIALAGIAIGVVIIVVIYNRWQESRYRKRAERAFATDHPDVLFSSDAERVEPRLGDLPNSALTDDVEEGLLSPIVSKPIQPQSGAPATAAAINNEIDTVALVLADTALVPDQFWPTIHQSRQVSERVLWEGLADGLWQPITENSDDVHGYREIRAGLQLANRAGPVDPGTLTAFDEMMTAFAQSVDAVSQREDIRAAAQRARKLDAFCADTDIEIVVHIIGRSGVTFATTKVRGLAESTGMTTISTGEYVMRDELGNVQYMLRNMSADEAPGIRQAGAYLSGLSFALDVPRTLHPEKTFERMMTLAMRFADTMQGEIVDDNRKQLTANGRKAIVDTIVQIAAQMESHGVVAGSPAALRLYS